MESVHQPIIPGLPDDLALRCLAMLSHGHHGVMEAVSKRWRDVMRSEEYANYKARQGWCGDWLFVHPERLPNQWTAYDPEADRWHPLSPPTPRLDYEMSKFGCQCVSNKLFVIGGLYWKTGALSYDHDFISNEVFQFDTFKKEWSTVTSMRTSRCDFSSCTMGGKIYVAGGCNSGYPGGMNLAEVYDPLTDKWEDLPPMPVPMMRCTGIAYKGKFQVISIHKDDQGLCQTGVFDPLSRSWHVKQENWSRRPNKLAVADDQVYSINRPSSRVRRRDAEGNGWHKVGRVRPMFDLNDPLEHKVLYCTLASLGHELYVMGGKGYMVDDGEFKGVFDLDRVRVCDPRSLPMVWRERRPINLYASGLINCWASLKQQR